MLLASSKSQKVFNHALRKLILPRQRLRLLWCACIFLLGIFGEKGKRLATGEKTALGEAFVWNGPCWMVN